MFDDFTKDIIKLIKENNYKLIADKIITILKGIKNDQNISSRRWVWELMQNATDVKFEEEKISIQIILSNDKLIFRHNGKYFKMKDILGLLQQVSSKDSQNAEGQTGKFGTGFIGTHLLSDVVDVEGILFIKKNDFREFKVSLDRSERKPEKLKDNIKNSIELFLNIKKNPKIFKPRPNYLKNRKETDYDTSFTYYLNDNEKKEAASLGVKDLNYTLPTTLITQYKKIKQVTIIDKINETETTYIPIIEGEEKKNDITESSVQLIFKKKDYEEIISMVHFISYLKINKSKEILRLIKEVMKGNDNIYLREKDIKKPVLYRNFPLIGSNEFYFPFAIDGFNFNPLESRNGLFLNGGKNKNNIETRENIDILNEAFDSSIEFIKLILKTYKNVDNRFYFASSKIPKPIVNFDPFAKNWILERQKCLRNSLRDLPLVKYKNNYYNLSYLLLPVFNEKCNKDFYNVIINLNTRNKIIPELSDYQDWYNIIIEENNEIQGIDIKKNKLIQSWGFTLNKETGEEEINYIYDEKDLFKDLKNCKNINNLCNKLNKNKNEAIEGLNRLFQFLKKNCQFEEVLNQYPIIPNRNGEFKKIEELYSDDDNIIPKDIMDIYDSISEKKLNEELIDTGIKIENLGDLLKKKNFGNISNYLNEYIIKNKDIQKTKKLVVYPLLSISSNIEEVSKIYNILISFYNLQKKEIIENSNTKIPIDLWTHSLNFWYREHPKEIEKYKNINGLQSNLIIKNIDALKWMDDYLNFLNFKSKDKNFQKLKIFPNQNGKFCALNDLCSDSGFPDEFKDILQKHFSIDKREILLDKKILTFKTHKSMHEKEVTKEIEYQFNKLLESKNDDKIKDVALDVLCLQPMNEQQKPIRELIEKIICPPRTNEQLSSNNLEYLGFAEIAYNKKDNFIIKNINTESLNYLIFINCIIEKICEQISKFNSFNDIKDKFYAIKSIDNLENFIIKLINFIWDNQNTNYPIKSCIDKNTREIPIFLNMYNEFCSIENIKIKYDYNLSKENEEIIFDICLNNYIKKDYRKKIINQNLYKGLSNHRHRFTTCSLKDICNQIDKKIITYEEEYYSKDNNNNKYEEEFFSLLKNVKNINCEKEILKELFPYYFKNKAKLFIKCVDESMQEKLIEEICKGSLAQDNQKFNYSIKSTFIFKNNEEKKNDSQNPMKKNNEEKQIGSENPMKKNKNQDSLNKDEGLKINHLFYFKLNNKYITPLLRESNYIVDKKNVLNFNFDFEIKEGKNKNEMDVALKDSQIQ